VWFAKAKRKKGILVVVHNRFSHKTNTGREVVN
jgi:hypothetical protein